MDCINIKREPSDEDERCWELPGDAVQYEFDIVEGDIKAEALDRIKQEPSCCYGLDVSRQVEKREDSPVVGVRLALPDNTSTSAPCATTDASCEREPVLVEHVCHACSYKVNQKKLLRIHQLFSCCEPEHTSACGSVPGTSKSHHHRHTASGSGTATSTGQQQMYSGDESQRKVINRNELRKISYRNIPKHLSCNECSFKTAFKSGLKRHQLLHTGHRPFACYQCDYKCYLASNLKTHEQTHTGQKRFVCDQCDYKCYRSCDLKRHKQTHAMHQTFVCGQCNCAFNSAYGLKRHKQTHTGYKPFACDQCDYKFYNASDLKSHKLTHSGHKLFACDEYAYTCIFLRNLKRHKQTHTKHEKITCDLCV